MGEQERVDVPVSEAMDRLAVVPDYDPGGEGGPRPCVHTFVDASFGLIGAHWDVEQAREVMEAHGVSEAGSAAAGMNHGLVVVRPDRGPVFFETKPDA